jgi:cell division septum initiation protein DivIVA
MDQSENNQNQSKKSFTFSNYGYTTAEVDEYIGFIESELARNTQKLRETESRFSEKDEEIKKLNDAQNQLSAKNDELYSDCVNFAKRLKELEDAPKEPEIPKERILDDAAVGMLAEIKTNYAKLIEDNKHLHDQVNDLKLENDSLRTAEKVRNDISENTQQKMPDALGDTEPMTRHAADVPAPGSPDDIQLPPGLTAAPHTDDDFMHKTSSELADEVPEEKKPPIELPYEVAGKPKTAPQRPVSPDVKKVPVPDEIKASDTADYTEKVVAADPVGIPDNAIPPLPQADIGEPQEFFSSADEKKGRKKKGRSVPSGEKTSAKPKLGFGFHLAKTLVIILLVADIIVSGLSLAAFLIGKQNNGVVSAAGYTFAQKDSFVTVTNGAKVIKAVPKAGVIWNFAVTQPYVFIAVTAGVFVLCVILLIVLASHKRKARFAPDFEYTDDDFSLKI